MPLDDDRRFHIDAEQFMHQLANNVRSEIARAVADGRDPDPLFWSALVRGASSALTATGQLSPDRASALAKAALQPFVDRGDFDFAEQRAEFSVKTPAVGRSHDAGERGETPEPS